MEFDLIIFLFVDKGKVNSMWDLLIGYNVLSNVGNIWLR